MVNTFRAVENSIQGGAENNLFYALEMSIGNLNPSRSKDKNIYYFKHLSRQKKDDFQQKMREKLICRSFINDVFFCNKSGVVTEKKIMPSFFELIKYLEKNGTTTVGIFRREGSKETYKNIVSEMILFDKTDRDVDSFFDFTNYKILELASALKYYIREILDGLFDYSLIKEIVNFIALNEKEKALLFCKYLVFSIGDLDRKFLIDLRCMLLAIVNMKSVNSMSWESICNIFSLTICPSAAFTSVHFIPIAVEFFRCIMETDFENIKGLL